MDCRLPHRYYVTGSTELLWFHFSGGESTAYVRLLTGSALSIEQIGFNSASHFSRVFRSREKMTPSKFRSINF